MEESQYFVLSGLLPSPKETGTSSHILKIAFKCTHIKNYSGIAVDAHFP